MNKGLLILLFLLAQMATHAAHIAGGELQYTYVGAGANGTDRYEITMRLFRECSSNGPQLTNETVNVGAYSVATNTLANYVRLDMVGNGVEIIQLNERAIPCLVGSPNVCYQVAIYKGFMELPKTPDGYTLAWARCCRAVGLMNAQGQIGATYIAKIPGSNILPSGFNSSPQFVVKDTALVCGNNDFVLDFGASDPDGDSLSYQFCEAYVGGTGSSTAPPPNSLLLQEIAYQSGYAGNTPMGSTVVINPTNGIISGIAPSTPGRYVVNVCVTEWRDGRPINQHRKDFILKVGDCNIISAKLKDVYVNCDSLTLAFQNESSSSDIRSYYCDFGVPNTNADTSNQAQPVFTYPDTGVYRIMLVINRNEECSDTATSLVKVFPGFTPRFNVNGGCYLRPFSFTDASTAAYGRINQWRWEFGDETTLADTSLFRNPNYLYPSVGPRNVTLFVRSSKGCEGTYKLAINASDQPALQLQFRDTLICSRDSLVLSTAGPGIFSWSPGYNIINATTANPTVFPKRTTQYIVQLADNTCIATDTVTVRVVDRVTLQLMADTAICRTDSLRIQNNSDGLRFYWSPPEGLDDIFIQQPKAAPFSTTTYQVTATIGSCTATDSVQLRVSPYPSSNAGRDTAICLGERLQLSGAVISNSLQWSPSVNIVNGNTVRPLVIPSQTTLYVLSAIGNNECPKTVTDSVLVTVHPAVNAFAGNDTTTTVDEPLQLQASGGISYQWSPTTNMTGDNTARPVIVLGNNADSVTYTVTVTSAEGCTVTDAVKVVVFKTGPMIFVPDAFTPNNDGRNDLLYPVLVGMRRLDFFSLYNRFGQLIFTTSQIGKGWDGRINGQEQPSGSFVYMVRAVNYKGVPVFRKGTVLLIR